MRGRRPVSLDVQRTASVFQVLSEAIVFQQLSAKAAETIYARVRAAAGGGPLTAVSILSTSDEALRAAGLSGAKTAALKDLAAHEEAGDVPNLAKIRRMSDDAIVERLTVVRGIGRWTVEMFLIFRLGRPDVLPVDDYGVRRVRARVRPGNAGPEGARSARSAVGALPNCRQLVPVACAGAPRQGGRSACREVGGELVEARVEPCERFGRAEHLGHIGLVDHARVRPLPRSA